MMFSKKITFSTIVSDVLALQPFLYVLSPKIHDKYDAKM